MNVKLLNPDEAKKLFYWWGKTSAICYDTKTDDVEKIGKGCFYSGHYSGSRSQYILFQIDDCPRFTIDQAVRHEEGVMKNVQSFRYVGKDSFVYEIPSEIKDNAELVKKYVNHMSATAELYEEIESYVFNKTKSKERSHEQARYVVPMSTHASFVIGFDIEALMHFCQMRLCVRTEDIHRQLAIQIKNATLEVLPELKARLVPKCQWYLWCDEGKKSCGAYPTRSELKKILKAYNDVTCEKYDV